MSQAGSTSQQDPSHKRRSLLLVAVGSVVAIVVIAAVLAQVLLGVFSGPPPPPGPEKISATFGSPSPVTDGFQFTVTNVSRALGPLSFKVKLAVNATVGTPAGLDTTISLTIISLSYTIVWADSGGERTLNANDRFQVIRPGGLPPSTVFTFSLLWFDDSLVQTEQYTSVPRPVITFGSVNVIQDGFMFSVAGASGSFAPANYKVNLQVNSTIGTAVPLALSMTIVVPAPVAATYTIAWLDPGGERVLNAGDTFEITRSGGLQPGTMFTFYLLWSDGTTIQTQTYTN